MIGANETRTGTRKNLLLILQLILFLVSCDDEIQPEGQDCLKKKKLFTATVSAAGLPTVSVFSESCGTQVEGDFESIFVVRTGFGFSSYIEIMIFNVFSTGEYKFGTTSAPGEPNAVCNVSYTTYGYDAFHDYSTNPIGSGSVIIDSLTADYISGKFNATLFSADSVDKATIAGGAFFVNK